MEDVNISDIKEDLQIDGKIPDINAAEEVWDYPLMIV